MKNQGNFHLTLMLIQMQSKMQNGLEVRCNIAVMVQCQRSEISLVSKDDWAELENFLPLI